MREGKKSSAVPDRSGRETGDDRIAAPEQPLVNHVVIGDIHGCANEFEDLLGRLLVTYRRPIVRLVGDLLTKGPDPAGVVRLIDAARLEGLDIHSVCGNHDLRLYAGLLRLRRVGVHRRRRRRRERRWRRADGGRIVDERADGRVPAHVLVE